MTEAYVSQEAAVSALFTVEKHGPPQLGTSSVVGCLPNMCELICSIPSTTNKANSFPSEEREAPP